ncbi:hypothetical protein [Bosea sp. (in: a-proteobacteria)]|jgi:hypothetical protein|uniref:hypothetical protein n=1 Tax=Bosea sp. (in: a-proteobacteria) TaxID=1871050 RepID=UPI001AD179C3|nr:hypothetical protein [Bosea sp. (in: a-proteobacteria)]MBN9440683.1 hypothetical protein [Bosea sp. (in: a-proteobacteria)]
MRNIIWLGGLVVLCLWSLIAWGGHALVDWTSDWAAANADQVSGVPEIVETVSWALRSVGNASEVIVVIVWALGAVLILGFMGLANRFLGRRRPSLSHPRNWRA